VYPQPTKGALTIDGAKEGSLVKVADITGRTVVNAELTNNQLEAFAGLNKGIYIIQFLAKSCGCTQTVRVVKE
jgi:hypothetical protein